jgi:hypothetical protein
MSCTGTAATRWPEMGSQGKMGGASSLSTGTDDDGLQIEQVGDVSEKT